MWGRVWDAPDPILTFEESMRLQMSSLQLGDSFLFDPEIFRSDHRLLPNNPRTPDT
jgi:hypothetical protein